MNIKTVSALILITSFFLGWKANGAEAPRETINDSIFDNEGRKVEVGSINNKLLVKRLNPDGTPDETFGDNGKFTFQSGISCNARVVTLQNEKIVVAGISTSLILSEGFVLRLNENGTLDSTFAKDGEADMDLQAISINGIAIDNNNILVVGMLGFSIYIVEFLSNGTLNSGFGDRGTTFFDMGAPTQVRTIIIRNGKILVEVTTNKRGSKETAFVVFNADGTVDTSVGENGVLFISKKGAIEAIMAVKRRPEAIAREIMKFLTNNK